MVREGESITMLLPRSPEGVRIGVKTDRFTVSFCWLPPLGGGEAIPERLNFTAGEQRLRLEDEEADSVMVKDYGKRARCC